MIFEGDEESSHTSNTSICWYFFWNLPICTREFLCLKYKTSGWKSEHRKILCIFAIVSSNESTRGSIIQAYKRKVLDLCHTQDSTLNLAHGMQETQNLKACEQGLIAYRTYLGDWPYQREDSCDFSIRIEQIDKSESRDVCQQLSPGKTWQAPFLWPTYSAGLGTTYNLSGRLKVLPKFFSTEPPFWFCNRIRASKTHRPSWPMWIQCHVCSFEQWLASLLIISHLHLTQVINT